MDNLNNLEATVDFVNVGLTRDEREKLSTLLNTLLADEHVLYAKTRNFHWNVEGPFFMTLHELFEQQYDELKLMGDDIAERVRKLGGTPIGTLTEFLDETRLVENPDERLNAREMVARLLEDHESIINYLREDIEQASGDFGDEGTADLLIATMRSHEEMAWMLRSMLAEKSF